MPDSPPVIDANDSEMDVVEEEGAEEALDDHVDDVIEENPS